MIARQEIKSAIDLYTTKCQASQKQPCLYGLSFVLGVSFRTLYNVRDGTYNGKKYGDKPTASRCISNDDFDLIRGL